MSSDRIEEMRELAHETEQRLAERNRGPHAPFHFQGRGQSNRYLVVIEFDSHEAVLGDSDDSGTTKCAEQMAALCTRPPSFTACDV